MTENEIGTIVVDSSFEIYSYIAPGLLESAYQKCLAHELGNRGITVLEEVDLPLRYKGIKLECGYRIDLLANKKVIVEVKTVDTLLDIHKAQLLTYLKLTGCKLGYLLNFKSTGMKYGIKRTVNKL
ncbi:GxxExxY protein [Rhodohalobacter sp. 8-1]|uniref:GxxExxY protein n=1 Tax=Rhodohalobacter sp. 8-1 TaxID=3131972 RepID=UPI0030EDC1B0